MTSRSKRRKAKPAWRKVTDLLKGYGKPVPDPPVKVPVGWEDRAKSPYRRRRTNSG